MPDSPPTSRSAAAREIFLAGRTGVEKVTLDGCTDEMGVGYVMVSKGSYPFAYVVWFGNAGKPSAHYAARGKDEAVASVRKHLSDAVLIASRKAEMRAAVKAAKAGIDAAVDMPVGTILTNSWGWEQTNVDFFKVVRVAGKATVECVAIGGKMTGDAPPSSMAGYCVADPDKVLDGGAIIRMRLTSKTAVAVPGKSGRSWGSHASKWDGKPEYTSWYG